MKRTYLGLLVTCITFCGNLPIFALVNGGFESGFPADFGSIESWEVFGNPNAQPVGFTRTDAEFSPAYFPHEGMRMALFSQGSNDFSGVLSQTFSTVQGTTYRINLKMGIVSESAGRKQALELSVVDGDGASILSKVETITSLSTSTLWKDLNITFVAASTQTRLILSDHSESIPRYQCYNSDLLIDNVSLSVEKTRPGEDTIGVNNKLIKFNQWLGSFGVTAGIDVNSDDDSMLNGIEYVIGTNPTKNNGKKLLPKTYITKADPDGNGKKRRYLVFSYRRSQLSAGDPDVSIIVEWRGNSSDAWKDVTASSGVIVKSEVNKYRGGIDLVSVYIPRSITKSTKLLTRLRVVAKQ